MEKIEIIKMIAFALIIICAMFYILDNFLVWKYHLEIVDSPCRICLEQYPKLEPCFSIKPAFPFVFSNISLINSSV